MNETLHKIVNNATNRHDKQPKQVKKHANLNRTRENVPTHLNEATVTVMSGKESQAESVALRHRGPCQVRPPVVAFVCSVGELAGKVYNRLLNSGEMTSSNDANCIKKTLYNG
ncbi:hypothetical protein CEXT_100611 [Caerostris extrusa]|uniref:Uncharacterized protein n=1 Tax=Caerostris extrusa TaxID=172846 RepID=A0AAV4RF68_CAEEX|nr:hypothetical protein CEXT_100611 [Caerostris extrusa]